VANATPEQMVNFNDLMARQRLNRVEWFSFTDANEVLPNEYEGGNDQSLLLEDIGGGRGHDLEAFKNANPNAEDKPVLQDLLPFIGDIKELHGDIVKNKYDFFTPQPVKGFFPPCPSSRIPNHVQLLTTSLRRKSILPPLHTPRLLRRQKRRDSPARR
jgi:hypothetical protein